MNESGTDPGRHLVETSASSWPQHRPKPEWILTDPQSSFAKGEFAEFCGMVGCGLSTTPGEAHWQNGAVETAVKSVKQTMRRLRNENTELPARLCGHLAASAHNQTEVVKGFSPIQWAFGSNPAAWRQDADPLEVNKNRGERPEGFWQQQRWRTPAEERRVESQTSQRTDNSQPRGPFYRTRQSGNARAASAARWTCLGDLGPMSTTLWRCAPEQLRMASEQEVITELMAKGNVVVRPVQDIMKGLKRFVDVMKEPFSPNTSTKMPCLKNRPLVERLNPNLDSRKHNLRTSGRTRSRTRRTLGQNDLQQETRRSRRQEGERRGAGQPSERQRGPPSRSRLRSGNRWRQPMRLGAWKAFPGCNGCLKAPSTGRPQTHGSSTPRTAC